MSGWGYYHSACVGLRRTHAYQLNHTRTSVLIRDRERARLQGPILVILRESTPLFQVAVDVVECLESEGEEEDFK